jgi:hypothetical protein
MGKMTRDRRGFLNVRRFQTTWHGRVRVQESSIAFKGACVWVFAEFSYSNVPKENAPHLHLSYADAVRLRDGLNDFIRAANLGKTCEPPRKTRPTAGYI